MNWKTKTLVFYGIGGLVLGIAAGIITVNNAEKSGKKVDISLKDGAMLGVNALSMIRKVIL